MKAHEAANGGRAFDFAGSIGTGDLTAQLVSSRQTTDFVFTMDLTEGFGVNDGASGVRAREAAASIVGEDVDGGAGAVDGAR